MNALAANLVFVVLVLTLLAHYALGSPRPIQILRASPSMAFAPADLHVEIAVTPDPANTSVVASCESADFYRSSGWTLEGAQSRRIFPVEWRELPQGDYTVTARVFAAGNERGRATAQVTRQ